MLKSNRNQGISYKKTFITQPDIVYRVIEDIYKFYEFQYSLISN
jgi:hypothetical protein